MNRVVLAALASALAGVPVLLVLAFLADHVASYRGTCGPYAPDISAYASAISGLVKPRWRHERTSRSRE